MVVLESSSEENLEALLNDNISTLQSAELVFFITASNIISVAALFSRLLPDVNVMGIHSFMFLKGKCDRSGTIIIALDGMSEDFDFAYGLIDNVKTEPVKEVLKLQKQVAAVNPGVDNTICMEFCTNNEEKLITTLNSIMKQHGITVFGSTTDCVETTYPSYIFYDNSLYDDACIYLIIKNNRGKIITEYQNIYRHHEGGQVYLATKVDKYTRTLIEIDGRPAAEVYCQELGITTKDIPKAIPYHPFTKSIGEMDYPVSIKGYNPDGSLTLFKQINQNDLLHISDLSDYRAMIDEHLKRIVREHPKATTMFTIDCVYRYQLFRSEGTLDWYTKRLYDTGLQTMGIMGAGEQYDVQHCNQSMVCAIFENDSKTVDADVNKKDGHKLNKDTSKNKRNNSPDDPNDINRLRNIITQQENRQVRESLNARIYPLDFMLRYITRTKDSIVRRETFILENLLKLRRNLISMSTDNTKTKEDMQEYAGFLLKRSDLIAERLADINLQIEDMGNMLEQTEYLINDVVYLDGLTEILNRAYYNIMSDELFNQSMKTASMSMAFFDIDNFKHFNTDYGHDFGDEVLKQLASQLKRHFRDTGITDLIRMGGDEFVI